MIRKDSWEIRNHNSEVKGKGERSNIGYQRGQRGKVGSQTSCQRSNIKDHRSETIYQRSESKFKDQRSDVKGHRSKV